MEARGTAGTQRRPRMTMVSSATTCLGLLKTPGLSSNGLQQMLLQGLMLLAAMRKALKIFVPQVSKNCNGTSISHAISMLCVVAVVDCDTFSAAQCAGSPRETASCHTLRTDWQVHINMSDLDSKLPSLYVSGCRLGANRTGLLCRWATTQT